MPDLRQSIPKDSVRRQRDRKTAEEIFLGKQWYWEWFLSIVKPFVSHQVAFNIPKKD